MKFRIDRDALADAVAWTARSLPQRPPVPVLAGMHIEVTDRLKLSAFDYEVSAQVTTDVDVEEPGTALVSGRLLAEISRSLKLLAKELNTPVVALAQLNRGPELRHDKRPLLADLRESGSLEQDPDLVILLHREDAYLRESSRPGEADLIVAKHRNGPTGEITVAFQGHYQRFVDLAWSPSRVLGSEPETTAKSFPSIT